MTFAEQIVPVLFCGSRKRIVKKGKYDGASADSMLRPKSLSEWEHLPQALVHDTTRSIQDGRQFLVENKSRHDPLL